MAAAPAPRPAGGTLTVAQAKPLLAEALRRWTLAGADTSALHGLDLRIADLPDNLLGQAQGHTITLDANGAGWGWFVDKTPRSDSEFLRRGNQGEKNRMDLLSALEHEIGHVLGLEHDADGVMAEALAAGLRRTPVAGHNGSASNGTGHVDWAAIMEGFQRRAR